MDDSGKSPTLRPFRCLPQKLKQKHAWPGWDKCFSSKHRTRLADCFVQQPAFDVLGVGAMIRPEHLYLILRTPDDMASRTQPSGMKP